MLFAGTDLVARIERAECGLLEDCAAAISARRPDARVLTLPLAGGIAAYTGPDSPLNKVAGLGFRGPVETAELERVEHELESRNAPVQVELANLADPSVGPLLSRRGYELCGFENVLGRAVDRAATLRANPDVRVSIGGDEELGDWLDTVVTGFAAPDVQGVPSHEEFPRDVLEGVIRDMAGAPGFLRYVARLDGRIAGGASMRVHEEVAQLCGAATLPDLRRRGVQTALLAARLERAQRAGCRVAVITTQPGSKSQQNVQRLGFELLYTRAVLVRPAQR
jgi:GNAT superfamily N-acetyltransferase